jgi:cell division septation protein DedD
VSGAANDVSRSHEPSYYEIALTNRQVIVAFVLLLLCLIAAFFSGVWIGRESGVRAATEQMVRNEPPPAEEKKEGQNLEEFEFFDSAKKGKPGKGPQEGEKTTPPAPEPVQASKTPAPAASPPAEPDADSTLAEDFGAEDTEAAPRTEPPAPAAAQRAQSQKPVPTPERVAQAKPAQEPPAGRTPKRQVEPSVAEPARGSSGQAGQAGQVVIQVFSSSEKDQAVRIRDRLVGGGQKAYLSPVEVAGRTMYRVRIGPFDSRDKAQKVAEQVRKGFKLDTWVTE